MDGNGANCPGCENLLTIPSDSDEVTELGVSDADYDEAIKNDVSRRVKKQHKARIEGGHLEWSNSEEQTEEDGLKIVIPIVLVSLLIIGGLSYLLLFDRGEPADVIVAPQVIEKDDTVQEVVNVEKEDYRYDSENEAQVARLEEFLTKLFAAKTVDEMLPYVHPSENIREKMIKFYGGESVSQSPFKELNFANNISDYPGFLTFNSTSKDYSKKSGILRYSEEKILLDWESYVAYSEMTWDELAEKRPTDPVKLRVTARRTQFYNDDFIDENKWQAVSLSSPNEDEPIYGYVLKGSATIQRLFNFGLSDKRNYILEVHFPENAKAGNQVVIKRILEEGWIAIDEN